MGLRGPMGASLQNSQGLQSHQSGQAGTGSGFQTNHPFLARCEGPAEGGIRVGLPLG